MGAGVSLDVEHLRSWIGREDVATDLVSADLARKFRATLDLPEGDLAIGTPAPRLLHWCLAQPAATTASLGEDGHPRRGGFLPPVPLPRRMWAGGVLTFHGELTIGDTIRRCSRIADVVVKEGRSGVLCFVTVTHEIDVAGRGVISEIQDIVYRDLDPPSPADAPPPKPPAAAPEGAHRYRVESSPPQLFRYSALTFNGHRIHYDQPYATQVEGYPGLVVHGPLQATLLYNLASELKGAPPARFTFRGQSPLFDTEPFFLNADVSEGVVKLWTARAGGPPGMSAEARWS